MIGRCKNNFQYFLFLLQRLDDDDDGPRGLDDADSNQHGALVKKMYDAQKQLEHGSEIAGQRSDVVRCRHVSFIQNCLILSSVKFRKQSHKMMHNVVVNVKKFKKMLINFVKQFKH